MSKFIITYFFTIIITVSVGAPTYLSFLETNFEVEHIDLGEEEENKKGMEAGKDLDVKIYYSQNSSLQYKSLEKKKRVSSFSKSYYTHYKNPVSPPPELFTKLP